MPRGDENDDDEPSEIERRREHRGRGERIASPACEARQRKGQLARRATERIKGWLWVEAGERSERDRHDPRPLSGEAFDVARVPDHDKTIGRRVVGRRCRRRHAHQTERARAPRDGQRAFVEMIAEKPARRVYREAFGCRGLDHTKAERLSDSPRELRQRCGVRRGDARVSHIMSRLAEVARKGRVADHDFGGQGKGRGEARTRERCRDVTRDAGRPRRNKERDAATPDRAAMPGRLTGYEDWSGSVYRGRRAFGRDEAATRCRVEECRDRDECRDGDEESDSTHRARDLWMRRRRMAGEAAGRSAGWRARRRAGTR